MDILRKWRELYDDAIRLCESIDRLPEECPCGDADEHLAGRCPCCGGHVREHQEHRTGRGCTELLASLSADVTLVRGAIRQAAGPLEGAVGDPIRPQVRRDILLTATDLDRLLEKIEGLSETVVGFLRTCTVSDLKRIKRHSLSLRAHCEQLNSRLRTP